MPVPAVSYFNAPIKRTALITLSCSSWSTILMPGGSTLKGLICPENSRFNLRARRPFSHGAFGLHMSSIHPECFGISANGATAQSRTNHPALQGLLLVEFLAAVLKGLVLQSTQNLSR